MIVWITQTSMKTAHILTVKKAFGNVPIISAYPIAGDVSLMGFIPFNCSILGDKNDGMFNAVLCDIDFKYYNNLPGFRLRRWLG